MKTFAAITALVLTAGVAAAATPSGHLVSTLDRYAPNAEASALSEAQAQMILNVAHDGSTESEKASLIRAIVGRG